MNQNCERKRQQTNPGNLNVQPSETPVKRTRGQHNPKRQTPVQFLIDAKQNRNLLANPFRICSFHTCQFLFTVSLFRNTAQFPHVPTPCINTFLQHFVYKMCLQSNSSFSMNVGFYRTGVPGCTKLYNLHPPACQPKFLLSEP